MTTNFGRSRAVLRSRRSGIAVLIATAAALATTAYTRDPARAVGFNCEGGDHFIVEFQPGHVRLRHGTGIFSLGQTSAAGMSGTPLMTTYTDGKLVLHTDGVRASLERTGMNPRRNCFAAGDDT
jgi:hypothetical protein